MTKRWKCLVTHNLTTVSYMALSKEETCHMASHFIITTVLCIIWHKGWKKKKISATPLLSHVVILQLATQWVYNALSLLNSQTDRDKCNCGLWFGWVFKRKHSLSTSLSACQRGPFVFQPVCACRLCLSATLCGTSGSHETKMGHKHTQKSNYSWCWVDLVWWECYAGRPLLRQTWISHL